MPRFDEFAFYCHILWARRVSVRSFVAGACFREYLGCRNLSKQIRPLKGELLSYDL
jgi:hypothetical protein